jgi:Ni/Fe-hydrogenase subunit HybB-like protein
LLVAVGAALSGILLLTTAWPAVQSDKRWIILAAILGLHLLLAAGFVLYFFHGQSMTDSTLAPVSPPVSAAISPVTKE